jgi:eukaryotic-like serine/threonine-protein kinase
MTERYLDANAVKRLLDGGGQSLVLPQEGDLVAEKYRILGVLGAGGVATVLEAHHELLDKSVALKVLAPEARHASAFATLAERFLVEARAAAKVDSPYVARVMDVGTLESGAPFIVMERLEGCNLDELLFLEERPKIEDAVDYVLQALQGLAHAHALGVVHRDLKPANLFLAKQPDGTSTVKVLDFGIAVVLDDAGQPPKSMRAARGTIVGSPMYMSPEQVRNDGTIDHRTDIWSIGVVLYELVTGKVPYGASSHGMGELFGAILNDPFVPASRLRPDVPKELDAVLAKALSRDLATRYADVSELSRALVPFGTGKWSHLADSIDDSMRIRALTTSGPDAFVKEPEAQATAKPKKGGAWIVVLFAVVALALAGAAAWVAHQRHYF